MKSFSDACGLEGPLQLVVEAGGESDVGVRVLHQPFAIVGRDPRADVPLEHRLVSRRHAYLQVVEGCVFWIDLGSRLGIHAAGRPRKHGWLTRDEPMRVGPYGLRLGGGRVLEGVERPPRSTPLVSRSYGVEPWPDVGLEFLNGPSRAAVWPMNRVVSLVGSAAGCKFRLADPSVSPFHCSLVRTRIGLWVVDLLGGDVAVNNAIVRHAFLADGDVLTVGCYRIRVRCRDVQGAAAAAGEARALAPAGTAVTTVGSGFLPARRDEGADAGRLPALPSSVAVLPAAIERDAATDPMAVLVPLMNQFGLMQQQMMDQFQSAMGMLVGMFGSLQREQMDLIRQELDQLREVTREVQELKAELASRAHGHDSARTVREAPAASPPPAPAPGPSAAPPPRPSVTDAAPDVPPADAPEPGSPSPEAASRGPARPGARPRPRPERPATGAKDADVMLWLNQRLNTLQEERESRWRKILKLLPGSS